MSPAAPFQTTVPTGRSQPLMLPQTCSCSALAKQTLSASWTCIWNTHFFLRVCNKRVLIISYSHPHWSKILISVLGIWGLCHHRPRGLTPSLPRCPLSTQAHLHRPRGLTPSLCLHRRVPPASAACPSSCPSHVLEFEDPPYKPPFLSKASHVIYVLAPGRHCAALWGLRRCLSV